MYVDSTSFVPLGSPGNTAATPPPCSRLHVEQSLALLCSSCLAAPQKFFQDAIVLLMNSSGFI